MSPSSKSSFGPIEMLDTGNVVINAQYLSFSCRFLIASEGCSMRSDSIGSTIENLTSLSMSTTKKFKTAILIGSFLENLWPLVRLTISHETKKAYVIMYSGSQLHAQGLCAYLQKNGSNSSYSPEQPNL